MKYWSEGKKVLQSLSFKAYAVLLVILVVLLIVMNIFTYSSPRDALYKELEGELLEQAKQLSTSLSYVDALDNNRIRRAVQALELEKTYQVVVIDQWGVVLYSSTGNTEDIPRSVRSDLIIALSGTTTYSFNYEGAAYDYDLAMPITNNGIRLGAVCLYCHDTARGGTFDLTVDNLRRITIILGIISALAFFMVTRSFTRRIRELNSVIRSARDGDYEQRVSLNGNDEITELSSEFNKLLDRLQKTEEVRRRFVADASHELKTPLSAIILMSDSIIQSDDMPQSTMREFISDIRDEAARLKRITEKLLGLTRLDYSQSVERSAVDLKKVTENVARILKPLAERSGVSLELGMPDEDYTVLASEDDVFQVVFNLAENAIKYNYSGGSAVLRLTADGSEICLTVEDTGIGIPKADIPHIFSRFYRVDKHRARATGGSGLGLSIVHDALLKCGGRIEVESEERQGTRFLVFFPRQA